MSSLAIADASFAPDRLDLTLGPIPAHHVTLELLRRHATVGLDPALAIGVVLDVANAMWGAVHGGLHPRRVIVLAAGDTRLVGTQTQGLFRVLAPPIGDRARVTWAAPELDVGDEPTTSADVHALGMLLFWLLTDDTTNETLVARARRADEPTIAPMVGRVIRRCLDPNPAHRFEDSLDFAKSLRPALLKPNYRERLGEVVRYLVSVGRGGVDVTLAARRNTQPKASSTSEIVVGSNTVVRNVETTSPPMITKAIE